MWSREWGQVKAAGDRSFIWTYFGVRVNPSFP